MISAEPQRPDALTDTLGVAKPLSKGLDAVLERWTVLRRGFNDPDRNPPDAPDFSAGMQTLPMLDQEPHTTQELEQRYWNLPDRPDARTPKDDLEAQGANNRTPISGLVTAQQRARAPNKDPWTVETVVPETPQTEYEEQREDEGMDRSFDAVCDAFDALKRTDATHSR